MKKILLMSSLITIGLQAAVSNLEIVPPVFDFGWCPDNAKVSCDIVVRNTSQIATPLTAVQPACGCTLANFTPTTLASNDETKVRLTFNTRGYAGVPFNKTAQVKTGIPDSDTSVKLKGHVLNPDAKVVPVGDGIAAFTPSSDRKMEIQIQNKGEEEVNLQIVQVPLDWAKADLSYTVIPSGQSVPISISVDGPLEQPRDTSLTLEAKAKDTAYRLTLAIRTGPPPAPYRIPPPAPKLEGTPTTPNTSPTKVPAPTQEKGNAP